MSDCDDDDDDDDDDDYDGPSEHGASSYRNYDTTATRSPLSRALSYLEAGDSDDDDMRPHRDAVRVDPTKFLADYGKLRARDEFAPAGCCLCSNRAARDGMLKYSSAPIPMSLLVCGPEANAIAVEVHTNILAFAAPRPGSAPSSRADYVLRRGLDTAGLADEIFCQLMKHCTSNPSLESVKRGWQLWCLATATFAPSPELAPPLRAFLTHQARAGLFAIHDYATYCLRVLDGVPSGVAPSRADVDAFGERAPFVADVTLEDGAVLVKDAPVSPSTDVAALAAVCAGAPGAAPLANVWLYDLGPAGGAQQLTVAAPPGTPAGAQLTVAAPSGAQFTVVVPPGLPEGGAFQVQVPPSEPLAPPLLCAPTEYVGDLHALQLRRQRAYRWVFK